MLKCKDAIYKKRDRASAEAYMRVKKFVEEASYSSCKKASDIAKLTLLGHDAHYLAEYFNKSYDTIRTEKRHISEDLWKLFPLDFFDKLENYQKNKDFIDKCLSSLGNSELTSTDFLFRDFVNFVQSKSDSSYVGEFNEIEFKDELHLLKLYSRLFMEEDMQNVDISKLKYLIDVLDGKTGSIYEKAIITSFIKEDYI